MKDVTVFYAAELNGEQGEAALTIQMEDGTAETLAEEYGKPGVFLVSSAYVATLLTVAEKLRGRKFIPGSIKSFQVKPCE